MKRISALLIALCLCVSLCGSAFAESNPLIYKVTDAEGHTLYMFGTVHMGTPEMYPLSAAVENAIDASDAIAVEMDTVASQNDPELQTLSLTESTYQDGDKASNHLSAETMEAVAAAIPSMPIEQLEMFRPFTIEGIVSSLKAAATAELGLEGYLINRFSEAGKPLYEAEGLASQLKTLKSLPDAYMDKSILSSLNADTYEVDNLMPAWIAGDKEALTRFSDPHTQTFTAELDPAVLDKYIEIMYTSRNKTMFESAKQYLASGETVFMAIGTAHLLYGGGGIMEMLANEGYTVEEIGR